MASSTFSTNFWQAGSIKNTSRKEFRFTGIFELVAFHTNNTLLLPFFKSFQHDTNLAEIDVARWK
jgi:hypothetical protein